MMRFADELADLEDFSFPTSAGIRPQEMKMARQLVENLTAKWEPAKYTDEYTANLMRVIQGKLKGKKPRLHERETQKADVIDLMARLRASLEGKGQRERASAKSQKRQGKTDKGEGSRAGMAKAKRTTARKADSRKRRVA
jgi:DNA end-binding protein Ku